MKIHRFSSTKFDKILRLTEILLQRQRNGQMGQTILRPHILHDAVPGQMLQRLDCSSSRERVKEENLRGVNTRTRTGHKLHFASAGMFDGILNEIFDVVGFVVVDLAEHEGAPRVLDPDVPHLTVVFTGKTKEEFLIGAVTD